MSQSIRIVHTALVTEVPEELTGRLPPRQSAKAGLGGRQFLARSTGANGPLRPLAIWLSAAAQLYETGHSSTVRHSRRMKVGSADFLSLDSSSAMSAVGNTIHGAPCCDQLISRTFEEQPCHSGCNQKTAPNLVHPTKDRWPPDKAPQDICSESEG